MSHVQEFEKNGIKPIISKGTYENLNGKILPHLVKHSFLEGLSIKEIFSKG